MRKLPIALQAVGHGGSQIRAFFPHAAILNKHANGAVLIEHRGAVLIVVTPVLAPVGAGLIPSEPWTALAIDGERRMRVEPWRFGHLLDWAGGAVRWDAAVENIVIAVAVAVPGGGQIAFAIERRVGIPDARSADPLWLRPAGGARVGC